MNELMTKVFVEQPLASLVSAKYIFFLLENVTLTEQDWFIDRERKEYILRKVRLFPDCFIY